jgi:hypothetical protein
MSRAAGVGVVCACAWIMIATSVTADSIDDRIAELRRSDNYKLRLASALALSKSSDVRALRALTILVEQSAERSLRRIAVLGLSKQLVDAAASARADGIAALDRVANKDRDPELRASAAEAVRELKKIDAELTVPVPPRPVAVVLGGAPRVFVNVDAAIDLSTKVNADGLMRLTDQVKKVMTRKGYATTWPGAAPTSIDLQVNHARGYIVAATVHKLEIKRQSERSTEVACTVAIRVAPWNGVDGKELWEADRAASASGSAKAQTGGSERDVLGGVRDCVEAVAEEIVTRQVIPFLRRLVES